MESSTFGSEFVAMRIAIEMIECLRYKLRMMGILLDMSCNEFCCDKNNVLVVVVINSCSPECMLKKKHAAINYHRTPEAVAAGVIRIAKEDTTTNLAAILTKCLPAARTNRSHRPVLNGRPLV